MEGATLVRRFVFWRVVELLSRADLLASFPTLTVYVGVSFVSLFFSIPFPLLQLTSLPPLSSSPPYPLLLTLTLLPLVRRVRPRPRRDCSSQPQQLWRYRLSPPAGSRRWLGSSLQAVDLKRSGVDVLQRETTDEGRWVRSDAGGVYLGKKKERRCHVSLVLAHPLYLLRAEGISEALHAQELDAKATHQRSDPL
jgi:hypothetical protein